MRAITGSPDARGLRVAIVAARFNDFVTDRLCDGAKEALRASGADDSAIVIMRVPGAFELPLAALRAAESRQFDAVVCVGCVIRGETPHFEYIASAAAHGIMQAAAATGVPITFGVLTTNSVAQAIERAGPGTSNKGWEAAMAAVEMATLLREIGRAEGERSRR
jgi:6,7-dimethyl-8-ribityllumazine synthase